MPAALVQTRRARAIPLIYDQMGQAEQGVDLMHRRRSALLAASAAVAAGVALAVPVGALSAASAPVLPCGGHGPHIHADVAADASGYLLSYDVNSTLPDRAANIEDYRPKFLRIRFP